jgi:hypothetical protein
MNDLEELLRDGINRLTAETEIPVGMVDRARRGAARRRHATQAAIATGMAAAAAVAAIIVTSVLSAGHQPSARSSAGHHSGAQLAAWTVVRRPDGDIAVTVRELRDPQGLQSTLRADGVPASVTFLGQQNPACRIDPSARSLTAQVIIGPARVGYAPVVAGRVQNSATLLIDPAALPSGVGVQLAAQFRHLGRGTKEVVISGSLVYASPQCTGS